MKARPSRLPGAALFALLAASCAQSVGDVNRVQPNVVRKSRPARRRVVLAQHRHLDTPHNTQFTFPGQTGSMEKLVFEVQERPPGRLPLLPVHARHRHQRRPDAPRSRAPPRSTATANGTCTGGQKYYGAPVVAFPIQSHFDIQRGYVAATGEHHQRHLREHRRPLRGTSASTFASTGLQQPAQQDLGHELGHRAEPGWRQLDESELDSAQREARHRPATTGRPSSTKTATTTAPPSSPTSTSRVATSPTPTCTYIEGWGNIPLCYFADGVYDCSSSEIHDAHSRSPRSTPSARATTSRSSLPQRPDVAVRCTSARSG
jgi:hypothetical protein